MFKDYNINVNKGIKPIANNESDHHVPGNTLPHTRVCILKLVESHEEGHSWQV